MGQNRNKPMTHLTSHFDSEKALPNQELSGAKS